MASQTTPREKSSIDSISALESSLSSVVQGQLDSVDGFDAWLDQCSAAGVPCQHEVISVARRHLATQRETLLQVKQARAWPGSRDCIWGPVRCSSKNEEKNKEKENSTDGNLVLSISGPAPDDLVEVTVAGASEAAALHKLVDVLAEMSDTLAEGESRVKKLLGFLSEYQSWHLSAPPHKTVQNHIRLLQQYNDVKDIGQQLIGLVAENRDVSVSSLYRSGQYGVSPED